MLPPACAVTYQHPFGNEAKITAKQLRMLHLRFERHTNLWANIVAFQLIAGHATLRARQSKK